MSDDSGAALVGCVYVIAAAVAALLTGMWVSNLATEDTVLWWVILALVTFTSWWPWVFTVSIVSGWVFSNFLIPFTYFLEWLTRPNWDKYR